jgi:hypothetical protein
MFLKKIIFIKGLAIGKTLMLQMSFGGSRQIVIVENRLDNLLYTMGSK